MAKIISVVSGKGGTGKSTISAALAKAFSADKYKVLAIDLDIGLRSLDILLSLENKVVFDFGDVLSKKCSLEKAIVAHDKYKNLYLLSSPNLLSKSFNLLELIDLIKGLASSFDFIILDMPAGLGISVAMVKELADINLIVTAPDTATIRDTKKISDAVYDCGKNSSKLIINKVSRNALRICSINNLDDIVDKVGIPLLGVIPEDEWINCEPGIKRKGKNSNITGEIFTAIAKRIEGQYTPLILRNI